MSRRVYVPADTTARSVGADETARAIAARLEHLDVPVELVRNGSRGLYWLEPLVEVATERGRIAFGPVDAERAGELFADGIPDTDHPACLGPTEALPELACQNRLTCQRVGITDPLSLPDYLAHQGYQGLARALASEPADIVQTLADSGLRGRGGAAFPVGIKWQTVLDTPGEQKYIVCNADEGDSGTFADRMIMESDPWVLIEGMTIAGLAVNATQGYLYVRSEYPQSVATLNAAIATAYREGYLGQSILGSGKRFELEVRVGAGAYICGEETAMLESLEGKRGMVRYKPPLPAVEGLFGKPTVVNNVISLATVPIILARGADYYRNFGVGRSRGTLTVQLAGNVRRGGLYELDFGVSLATVIGQLGGGSRSGQPVKAAQVGGPLGAFIPASRFDLEMDYEKFDEQGAMLGHGGVVVFDQGTDMGSMARFSMEFCEIESCGKCTPCRIGSVRGKETIDRIRLGVAPRQNRLLLRDLCQTMTEGSLCAMGGLTPNPVLSVLEHFPEEL